MRNPSHKTYERRWAQHSRELKREASIPASFRALAVGDTFRFEYDAEPCILRKLDARRYVVLSGSAVGNGLTCEIGSQDGEVVAAPSAQAVKS